MYLSWLSGWLPVLRTWIELSYGIAFEQTHHRRSIKASLSSSEPRAAHLRPAFQIRTKATPCVEIW